MFYLSIENSPKLTTKIGVTTITGDPANFKKTPYELWKGRKPKVKYF